MELEYSLYCLPDSDLDLSFTSTAPTDRSISARSSLARSSLTLSFNESRLSSSSSSSSSAVPSPHPRPHRRHGNPAWDAIAATSAMSPDGAIRLRHFKLLRLLGAGDLGRVFLCRLRDSDAGGVGGACFALKVVDRDALTTRKLSQAQTEARILSSLDHPFLPTLYAHLDVSHYTCLLIDYCSNGDLHSLLRKQPASRLPIQAIRFFAAEVLTALEYLHARGIVYRDLKPENILIRGDGHVMLSDFDLCFLTDVSPQLSHRSLRRRRRGEEREAEFVAEPTAALSRSCVGTHEYLSPEMATGSGHGSSVDWWAFGVLIYELLYGATPFKGGSKESTLRNIVSAKGVRFPPAASEAGTAEAMDLIEKLLVKDPRRRLGSSGGATDIKRHPFFKGIRWPLIRTYRPPEVHGLAVEGVRSKAALGGGAATGRQRGFWERLRCLVGLKGSKCRLNDNQNYYSYVSYEV